MRNCPGKRAEAGHDGSDVEPLISYILIAGKAIASHVEEPFGTGEDHLDLEGIVKAIDESVSEVLDDDS